MVMTFFGDGAYELHDNWDLRIIQGKVSSP
jgi:hypothetical protein